MSEQPIVNITGERIALGPHRRDLVPLYQKWINDFEVTRTLNIGWRPMTRESEESWYDTTVKDERERGFTVYERDSMRPIGTAGLYAIDFQHRMAEFGIMLGEKDCWGKGYGTEVTRLLLDYGFNALDLHMIMLHALATNERGVRAYLRAGFKLIGRMRQCHRIAGTAYDVILMDCLSTEFESPVLTKLMSDA